jgi:hypothetical protein
VLSSANLNSPAQAQWLWTVEVFDEHGESTQLKLFPSEAVVNEAPGARVLVKKVRLERTLASVLSANTVFEFENLLFQRPQADFDRMF